MSASLRFENQWIVSLDAQLSKIYTGGKLSAAARHRVSSLSSPMYAAIAENASVGPRQRSSSTFANSGASDLRVASSLNSSASSRSFPSTADGKSSSAP